MFTSRAEAAIFRLESRRAEAADRYKNYKVQLQPQIHLAFSSIREEDENKEKLNEAIWAMVYV